MADDVKPLPVAEALELADRALFFSGQEGRERARETLRLLGEAWVLRFKRCLCCDEGYEDLECTCRESGHAMEVAERALLAAEEESDAD
jgi:hypothetical protein